MLCTNVHWTIILQGVFLSVPPDFQCQNETTCQANEELFYIEILLAKELWLAATCFFFHFGSENWEEQVKNTLYKIYQVAQFFLTVKWKSSFSFVLSKLNLHPLINNIENFGQRFSDLFVTVFNILVPVYLKNSVKKASSVLIFFRWGLFFTQSLKILTMAILVMKCLAYNLSKISWEITWVCIQIILWWFTFFFEHRRKFTQCIFFPWRSCSLFSFKSFVVNLRVAISAASLTSSSPNSALATLRLCIMNQGIHIRDAFIYVLAEFVR